MILPPSFFSIISQFHSERETSTHGFMYNVDSVKVRLSVDVYRLYFSHKNLEAENTSVRVNMFRIIVLALALRNLVVSMQVMSQS